MELVLIAAGAAVAYFILRPKTAATADITTPAPAPAKQLRVGKPQKTFSGADAIVSGGYQTAPFNSSWAGVPPPSNALVDAMMRGKGGGLMPGDPSSSIANAVAASAAMLASTISSPPIPAPPPIQRGGIAGTVGTGGLPLGGALRTGLTSGTATTVVGTTRLQLLPLTSFVR